MKILAAVDLRDEPGPVVAAATTWAVRLGATLDLLFVDGLPVGVKWVSDVSVRDLMTREYERLREKDYVALEALLETVPPENRGTVTITDGPPARTLVERGKDHDAIVVATAGRTGIAHFWLGSVAERVVRTATVPVIVMRPQDE